jgi:hypothetical protein
MGAGKNSACCWLQQRTTAALHLGQLPRNVAEVFMKTKPAVPQLIHLDALAEDKQVDSESYEPYLANPLRGVVSPCLGSFASVSQCVFDVDRRGIAVQSVATPACSGL